MEWSSVIRGSCFFIFRGFTRNGIGGTELPAASVTAGVKLHHSLCSNSPLVQNVCKKTILQPGMKLDLAVCLVYYICVCGFKVVLPVHVLVSANSQCMYMFADMFHL